MGTEVSKVKQILRGQMRQALAGAQRPGESLVGRRAHPAVFWTTPKLAQAQTVMLYYGVGHEIRTEGLIQTLLDQGQDRLPAQVPAGNQMEARAITSLEDLAPDRYAIPAPKDTCPVVEREKLDLILVPGLCFDSRGSRLGQGRGLL